MRISDWSSDVCSSDLLVGLRFGRGHLFGHHQEIRPADRRPDFVEGPRRAARLPRWRDLSGTLEPRIARLDRNLALVERPRCGRSEEHTSELQSLMSISYAVFCLNIKTPSQH